MFPHESTPTLLLEFMPKLIQTYERLNLLERIARSFNCVEKTIGDIQMENKLINCVFYN